MVTSISRHVHQLREFLMYVVTWPISLISVIANISYISLNIQKSVQSWFVMYKIVFGCILYGTNKENKVGHSTSDFGLCVASNNKVRFQLLEYRRFCLAFTIHVFVILTWFRLTLA